jgi:hypothetical protein
MQARAVGRLASSPAKFAELRLRQRTLRAAEVVGGDAVRLSVFEGGVRGEVLWSDLETSQVVELVRVCLGDSEPAVRLGLGLYCLRAGRVVEGRESLRTVEDPPWADVAKPGRSAAGTLARKDPSLRPLVEAILRELGEGRPDPRWAGPALEPLASAGAPAEVESCLKRLADKADPALLQALQSGRAAAERARGSAP